MTTMIRIVSAGTLFKLVKRDMKRHTTSLGRFPFFDARPAGQTVNS